MDAVNVRELRDKRNTLIKEAESLFAGIEKAEDRAQALAAHDAKIKELDELDGLLERAEGLDQRRNKQFTRLNEQTAELGMSSKDLQDYSIVRGIRAMVEFRKGNPNAWEQIAPFEAEVSGQVAKRVKKEARGFFVPVDVMREKRDLDIATSASGGYLKATATLSMIELLRNRMILQTAGANVITGLVGDVAFPKQTAAATAYWVTEGNAPTESQQTLGQLLMQPKTVAAWTDYTRKLINQASLDVENFVRSDLTAILARELDRAGLHGASNGPTGIAATSGIGSVAGGTNGAAPTWVHVTQLEREVAIDNADLGALAYITNPKVRYKLRNTYRNATYGEIPIWGDNPQQPLNGYPSYVTTQVSSTLTKGSASGTCSAIFFGNWNDVIIALWSGIDILVDPYSLSTTGSHRIVAFQDAEVGLRHPESIAAMLDALPA